MVPKKLVSAIFKSFSVVLYWHQLVTYETITTCYNLICAVLLMGFGVFMVPHTLLLLLLLLTSFLRETTETEILLLYSFYTQNSL